MDRVSKTLSEGKSCKPLRGLVGADRVSDVLCSLNVLMEQCVTVCLVAAGGNWAVMANRKDPKKDSPLEDSSAKKYSVLVADRLKLENALKDRSMIDSEARRSPANDHFLPPFMTKIAAELVLDTATFSCAFDKFVWAQFQQNKLPMQTFRESLERFLNINPEKYSLSDTYKLLVLVRDRMTRAVLAATDRGNDQSKLMSKAHRHSQPQQAQQVTISQVAEAMRQISQQAHHQTGNEKKKMKVKHEDEAMGAFAHNPNPAQEKAATNAATNQSAKKLARLEGISGDQQNRAKIIRESVCKYFWTPDKGCGRENCRFAHVGQAETRAMGIPDDEVSSALN